MILLVRKCLGKRQYCIKCKTIQLLQDTIGKILDDLGNDDDFRYNIKGMIRERNNRFHQHEDVPIPEIQCRRMRRPATE